MAESPEHQFLSQCVSDVLQGLARTNLYGYVEAERRKYDFACELLRDWSRPLVGQTLWNHTAGLDKDLRTMLLDAEAEICVYVARDTVKARRLLSEGLRDFRAGAPTIAVHRLRVLWVPADFDADDEEKRDVVRSDLADRVGRDVLMNVVLGNLSGEDVRFFVRSGGLPGLSLAVLHAVSTAEQPRLGVGDLVERLGVSGGAVRERVLRLLGCGFLAQFGGGATGVRTTPKGRVFLDLCCQMRGQLGGEGYSAELQHILALLDMRYSAAATATSAESLHLAGPLLTEVPEMVAGRVLSTIDAAVARWGLDMSTIRHEIHAEENWEQKAAPWLEKLRARDENGTA